MSLFDEMATALGSLNQVATCIGCGCDDLHACHTQAGPCSWLIVDREEGTGVCSGCEGWVEPWLRRQGYTLEMVTGKENGARQMVVSLQGHGMRVVLLSTRRLVAKGPGGQRELEHAWLVYARAAHGVGHA